MRYHILKSDCLQLTTVMDHADTMHADFAEGSHSDCRDAHAGRDLDGGDARLSQTSAGEHRRADREGTRSEERWRGGRCDGLVAWYRDGAINLRRA